MIPERLTQIQSMLARNGLEAIALVPGANFRYLFGRDFPLMERPLVVIVCANGDAAAIVPALEMAAFASLNFPGAVLSWRDETGYANAFLQAGRALPALSHAKAFGLEAQRMRVFESMALAEAFPAAHFTDAHAAVCSLRIKKTAAEIAQIKEAIRISALWATLGEVKIGQTEKHIEGILLRQLFDHGAQGLAFSPIVAAGDNSAQPHARARADYRVKAGDALLIDFGASYQGYNADITRTFFIAEVSALDRDFYETVLAANACGKQAAKAGVTAHQVDDAVQQLLEDSQFARYIRHKTGHGLGLDVHEAPQIMRGNATVLEAGMVFTIEPGLYREGECGVRIEDDAAVTETGVKCLTAFPRELQIAG